MIALVFCSARKTCSGCLTEIASPSTRISNGRNGRAFKAASRLVTFILANLNPAVAKASPDRFDALTKCDPKLTPHLYPLPSEGRGNKKPNADGNSSALVGRRQGVACEDETCHIRERGWKWDVQRSTFNVQRSRFA